MSKVDFPNGLLAFAARFSSLWDWSSSKILTPAPAPASSQAEGLQYPGRSRLGWMDRIGWIIRKKWLHGEASVPVRQKIKILQLQSYSSWLF